MASILSQLLGVAVRVAGRAAAASRRSGAGGGGARRTPTPAPALPEQTTGPGGAYPGDFRGAIRPVYAPDPDGEPDPGEIVWTWVPYEEDHTRGKDRPVLVVAHDGPWLLALMLSSRDHDAQPGEGRWLDLGTGEWDARRRPSEVRLDRVVRVDPAQVRREGAVLDRARFDQVVQSLGGSAA